MKKTLCPTLAKSDLDNWHNRKLAMYLGLIQSPTSYRKRTFYTITENYP